MKYFTQNGKHGIELGNGKGFNYPINLGGLTEHTGFFGSQDQLARAIAFAGLRRPTSEDIADLVYEAFQNKAEEVSKVVIHLLGFNGWREFTGNLYLPRGQGDFQNGVIVEDNPKVTTKRLIMDKNSLAKRLLGGDPLVRFVPLGFKVGVLPKKGLGKHPYLIARYGEERADKMEQIVSQNELTPYLFGFESVNDEKILGSVVFTRGVDPVTNPHTELVFGGDDLGAIGHCSTLGLFFE